MLAIRRLALTVALFLVVAGQCLAAGQDFVDREFIRCATNFAVANMNIPWDEIHGVAAPSGVAPAGKYKIGLVFDKNAYKTKMTLTLDTDSSIYFVKYWKGHLRCSKTTCLRNEDFICGYVE